MTSFDRLTDQEALNVKPMRIEVVAAGGPMALSELVAQRGSPVSLQTIALLNQMEPTTPLNRGQLVKLVVGQPPP